MNSRAEFLALLRTRSDHELGEFYRVTSDVPDAKDGLWVGPDMRCQIGGQMMGADALTAVPGLRIHPSPDSEHSPASLAVIAALLSSRILRVAIEAPLTIQTLEALPLPARHGLFEAQLEALWHHASSNFSVHTSGPEWRAIWGSFDRICAELYHLSLDELMTYQ